MITGIFMASGQSLRMGQNKLLLPFQGKPLYRYGLDAITGSQVGTFLVVTSHKEIAEYCTLHQISFVFNHQAAEGQSSSIRLGVQHCTGESDYMFFVADQPLLEPVHIDRLLEVYSRFPGKIIVPKYKNTPGNPTIFPNKFRNELLGLTGDVRGRRIIQTHLDEVKYARMEDGSLFTDIDSPEDYKRLVGNPYSD